LTAKSPTSANWRDIAKFLILRHAGNRVTLKTIRFWSGRFRMQAGPENLKKMVLYKEKGSFKRRAFTMGMEIP